MSAKPRQSRMQPVGKISVIVPTHNPREGLIEGLIISLTHQSLEPDRWELCIVDNAGASELKPNFAPLEKKGVTCHLVREENPGLTFARLAGFHATTGQIIVMLDDDNLPAPDYLLNARDLAEQMDSIGTFGGKSIPRYEVPPPPWFAATSITLGCRDLGDKELVSPPSPAPIESYPAAAPIGAGMILRREVADRYRAELERREGDAITDRKAGSLSSGGDCDIVLTSLRAGWGTAYFPQLTLTHLISADRLQLPYLRRMAFDVNRSWVKVLAIHGILPWPKIPRWTLGMRSLKAWWTLRAFAGPVQLLHWEGARGKMRGLCEI